MKIISQNAPLPPGVKTVVTVGNFDGVHRGHTRLIARTVCLARERGAASAVVTFEPHTRSVVYPELSTKLLTMPGEKAALMEELGVDYVFIVDFDENFRQMGQEAFIGQVLAGGLCASGWVMSEGHRVGQNLGGLKKNLHFDVGKYYIDMFTEVPVTADGAVISSTRIRKLVSEGRLVEAAGMLGRPYLIAAERVAGVKVATKLGFPTLNFRSPEAQKVIPPAGVYAAEIEVGGKIGIGGRGIDAGGIGGDSNGGSGADGCGVDGGGAVCGGSVSGKSAEGRAKSGRLAGALYFGNCPTYAGRDTHFEFHALRIAGINSDDIDSVVINGNGIGSSFREPAIGETVHLWLHKYIRPDIAFPSESELKGRIAQDVNEINKYFSEERLEWH